MTEKTMSELQVCVQALDHEGVPWQEFRVERSGSGMLLATRTDEPGSAEAVSECCECATAEALYAFFGNAPLANYLYGRLGAPVPGLRTVTVSAERQRGVEP